MFRNPLVPRNKALQAGAPSSLSHAGPGWGGDPRQLPPSSRIPARALLGGSSTHNSHQVSDPLRGLTRPQTPGYRRASRRVLPRELS